MGPCLINVPSSDFVPLLGLMPERVVAGIALAEQGLSALGYDVRDCLIDFGETAAGVVAPELQKQRFDCKLLGVGVSAVPRNLILV